VQNCVIAEYENDIYICMANIWSFGKNATYGGKFSLQDDFKQLILKEISSSAMQYCLKMNK